MTATRLLPGLEEILREVILRMRSQCPGRKSERGAEGNRQIRALVRRDYSRPLRLAFRKAEVRELLRDARRLVWPHLNREPLRLASPREFREAWSPLGIDFRMAKLSSPEGLSLLGFYLGRNPVSKRPLICVNTAHHVAAMSGAFAHEMGHHLTSKMFDRVDDVPHLMGYLGYGDHLEDPQELAADILVSLGILPRKIAEDFFNKGRILKDGGCGAAQGITDAVAYIANRYGFNTDSRLSLEKRMQYLAGVLHYARLRKALLEEFET